MRCIIKDPAKLAATLLQNGYIPGEIFWNNPNDSYLSFANWFFNLCGEKVTDRGDGNLIYLGEKIFLGVDVQEEWTEECD